MKTRSIILTTIVFWHLIYSGYAQCPDLGFETMAVGTYTSGNAVTGWSLSSASNTGCTGSPVFSPGSAEFQIVNTPVFGLPGIGTLPNSPLGGNRVAVLNSSTANNSITRITATISVVSLYQAVFVSWATIAQTNTHVCCEQPAITIRLLDTLGNALNCPGISFNTSTCSPISYSLTGNLTWRNWQVNLLPLPVFSGTCVTLEVMVSDCSQGDHYGQLYLDAQCVNAPGEPGLFASIQSSFCPGSSNAILQGPFGQLSYSWVAPASSPITSAQSTNAVLSLTNAVPGTVYTLNLPNSCLAPIEYTLSYSTVSIGAIASSSTCPGGSGGTSTVFVSGSNNGYNFSWANSSNSVIATSSVATGLSPGIYSVAVSSPSCGSVNSTVQVIAGPVIPSYQLNNYCLNQPAYLNAPPGSGFQWYFNGQAIPASQGGNQQQFINTNPVNGSGFSLGFLSSAGCRDSILYSLISTSGNTLTAVTNTVCSGSLNGQATLNISGPIIPSSTASLMISSLGSYTPAFNGSMTPVSSTSYSVAGLSGGISYSVSYFDGYCNYTKSLTVGYVAFDYSMGLSSGTVCSGSNVTAGVQLLNQQPFGAYTYSWQPQNMITTGNIFPLIAITPTAAPGTSSTYIYSVTVTPTLMNCPLTKTMAITADNLIAFVVPIPTLCPTGTYSPIAFPGGGYFSIPGNPSAINGGSVIVNQSANTGTNLINYTFINGSCTRTASTTFTVMAPQLVTSPGQTVCAGSLVTHTASGLTSYSWNAVQGGPSFSFVPQTSTVHVVSGFDNSSCFNSATILTTALPVNSLSITGPASACSGQSITLTGSGANTFTWNTGQTSGTITKVITTSTVFSIQHISPAGCASDFSFAVQSLPSPTLSLAGSMHLCPGQTTTITASGAQSYVWSTSATGSVIVVSPGFSAPYYVTGSNGICHSVISFSIKVDCTALNSIETTDILVFPNPASDLIKLENATNGHLEILNPSGKIVRILEINSNSVTIDLSDLPNGLYLLTIKKGKRIKPIKLVKH